ncbi:MAG: hypothetical protein ACFFAO_10615 [Candidatus Hermodarchaeota archaeon]
MEIHKLLKILAGIILFISAFTHLIFLEIDYDGAIYFYLSGNFPPEGRYGLVEGFAMLGGALFMLVLALIFSIICAILYFIIGMFLILFKSNIIVPILAIIFTIIGIFFGLRVIIVFQYISALILFHLIVDIVVLAISAYSLFMLFLT